MNNFLAKKKSYILAVDAGTTSVKGVLFDSSGKVHAMAVREYTLEKPSDSIVEIDPCVYWDSACSVIKTVLSDSRVPSQHITAVGVTGQGETLILLDKDGRPLRKAIVWLDSRAGEEAKCIRNTFGRDAVYGITGQQDITAGWPAAKILWLARHEAEVFRRTDKFLMAADYLIYRLCGKFVTNHGLNPSTLYYDILNGCWWKEMLDFIGITPQQLPVLQDSGIPVGNITADIGLSSHTIVAAAPIDQICGTIGAGNTAPGIITETTGSALAVCASVTKPVCDPLKRFGVYRHGINGLFVLMPWIPTAGMVLRWFRDEFCADISYEEMTALCAEIPPGSDGLVLLPHLEGMVCPDTNPDARGVFYGISLRHRKAHFIRAVLESTAFALRENIDMLESFGIQADKIISLGGAARSAAWLQIKADVLQRPLSVLKCEEATSLGAAITAAVAGGIYADIAEAGAHMVHIGNRVEPNPVNGEIYRNMFSKYKALNAVLFTPQKEK